MGQCRSAVALVAPLHPPVDADRHTEVTHDGGTPPSVPPDARGSTAVHETVSWTGRGRPKRLVVTVPRGDLTALDRMQSHLRPSSPAVASDVPEHMNLHSPAVAVHGAASPHEPYQLWSPAVRESPDFEVPRIQIPGPTDNHEPLLSLPVSPTTVHFHGSDAVEQATRPTPSGRRPATPHAERLHSAPPGSTRDAFGCNRSPHSFK